MLTCEVTTGQPQAIAFRMGRPKVSLCDGITTKTAYIAELAADKGQFLPDGMMPTSGPATVLGIEKFVGNVTGPINMDATYTNAYAVAANKLEGFPG
jgi:NitT/TauT family transport system substrate-binding protein